VTPHVELVIDTMAVEGIPVLDAGAVAQAAEFELARLLRSGAAAPNWRQPECRPDMRTDAVAPAGEPAAERIGKALARQLFRTVLR
jgi:hypothetical protein